jgi:hypothetical protein
MRAISSASASTIKEGMALVNQLAQGTSTVAASTGSAYEPFYGIALGPIRIDTVGVLSQQMVPTSANLAIALIRQSVANTVGVIRDDGTMLTMSTSTAGSQPTASGGTVVIWTPASPGNVDYAVFAAADVAAATALGYNWTALYRYVYLPIDIQSIVGSNLSPGVVPEAWINEIPCLSIGTAATDCYCTDENWYGATENTGAYSGQLKVVAGGLFAPYSSSKAGLIIPGNVAIIQPPTTSDPWLIVEVR